jgi:hypothetical protein
MGYSFFQCEKIETWRIPTSVYIWIYLIKFASLFIKI